jgi:hypothetical protein
MECYPLWREGELLADYSLVQVMRNDKHPHHAVAIHVHPPIILKGMKNTLT